MDDLNNADQNNYLAAAQPLTPEVKKSPTMSEQIAEIKSFFDFTGGSFIYCLSAAFIAYGISKIMGPILADGDSLLKALPCIITLHVYELAILGALLLVVADTLARVLVAPTELPVGVITAIIGVPFFISLLRNRHHYGMQS